MNGIDMMGFVFIGGLLLFLFAGAGAGININLGCDEKEIRPWIITALIGITIIVLSPIIMLFIYSLTYPLHASPPNCLWWIN